MPSPMEDHGFLPEPPHELLLPDEIAGESEGASQGESSWPSLDEVEEIIGYSFKDRSLLEEAFTHASSASAKSYERLEYVGDSVLNLLITKEQFFRYPNLQPGSLTRLRAANVDTEKLARVAIKHGLHRFLRHQKPLLAAQIREFTQDMSDYPLHSSGLIDVPKALADIVESTIGAVFIDSNSSIDIVWKVFQSLLEPVISPDTLKIHPVTELYEVCQKRNLKIRFEDMWRESTAFNVFVEDQLMGTATYSLKKEIAHNRAAKDALDNIRTRDLASTSTVEDAFLDKIETHKDITESRRFEW